MMEGRYMYDKGCMWRVCDRGGVMKGACVMHGGCCDGGCRYDGVCVDQIEECVMEGV